MAIDQTVNARYGRIILGLYAGVNALLLIGACVALWYFNAQAHHHGIAPNAKVGFRTQHTLASLHGWYVAQRTGFHFAAVAATSITVVVCALVAVAAIRRLNPLWILIVPIVGGIAVGGSIVLAGHRADAAAVSVEKPAAAPWTSRHYDIPSAAVHFTGAPEPQSYPPKPPTMSHSLIRRSR